MTQEALKLALDALENHTAIKHPQQIHYRDKAITAIKEALAQTQEPVALETLLKWDDDIDDIDPIGEVVGFIEGSPYIMVKVHKGKQVSLDDDLYATPPQRTEQDGQCKRCTDGCPACDATKLQKESHDLL
jgi:hypothetical protein